MGSTPKPATPAQQQGGGMAGITAGVAKVAAPGTARPAAPPQNYMPMQLPPEEQPPAMELSSPSLAVPFAPNSSNPLGSPSQPDPRMQILKTLFAARGGR